MLVCAPSNAALDAIILRLLESHPKWRPVRIGKSDKMQEKVALYTMEKLANDEHERLEGIEFNKDDKLMGKEKREIINKILKDADVIFATLR